MVIDFVKLNPSENMTILVTTPIAREMQPQIAAQLMAYGSVYAEQVGFLEKPLSPRAKARLQMMGGEFCGNASMSMGAYLGHINGMIEGNTDTICIEVSGAPVPLNVIVRKTETGYINSVEMPLPDSIEEVKIKPGITGTAVSFPGITHIVLPSCLVSKDEATRLIGPYCDEAGAPCLGFLLYDDDSKRIDPLVYVRETGSAVWERGCGSGTAAIGAYLSGRDKSNISATISQPGGAIRVDTRFNGSRVTLLTITGQVKISAIGQAFL